MAAKKDEQDPKTPDPEQDPAPEPKAAEWDGTFTDEQQEAVGRIVKKRGAEYVSSFAKGLGYEDPDALKGDLAELKKRMEKEMSELEKAQAKALEFEKKAQAAEASRQAAERQAKIISTASRMNFADPADAVALVGDADADAVEDLLKKLADQKPYLLQTDKKKRPPTLDPNNPGPVEKAETIAQKRARIHRMGSGDTLLTPEGAEQHGGGLFWGSPANREAIESDTPRPGAGPEPEE